MSSLCHCGIWTINALVSLGSLGSFAGVLNKGDFSDEQLIELCRASADRVASWRAAPKCYNEQE